jgi:excinuclease ABC subunit A
VDLVVSARLASNRRLTRFLLYAGTTTKSCARTRLLETPTVQPDTSLPSIRILGARTNNLRGIDVDIPQNKLVVITGPSGSGKSSLAFDTLFAEGQRQYVETLSTYARQFLHQLERPAVDNIQGLPPTICVDQRQGATNPRSTVGTVTEIYDYLRVLIARFGVAHCFSCGGPILPQSPEQLEAYVQRLPEGTKTILLAPLVRGRKGEHRETLASIRKTGLVRARIDGEIHDVDHLPTLDPNRIHSIEAVVDRIVVREGIEPRVTESVRLALQLGDGVLGICYQREGEWIDEFLSTRYACPNCNVNIVEIEPRSFSFNSPFGACPACQGLGVSEQFDPEMVVADRSKSIAKGAILLFGETPARRKKLEKQLGSSIVETLWKREVSSWTDDEFQLFWTGADATQSGALGLADIAEKEWSSTTDPERLDEMARFRSRQRCVDCHGSRLRPEAMSIEVDGQNIHQICEKSIEDATSFFEMQKWQGPYRDAAELLTTEILRRLRFLDRVGLSYLNLSRASDTLSGGELQRVRLATCIGSGLVGVCYVLDEPSIGLHSRDTDRLISCLEELRDLGNTVVVVEHDESIICAADHIVDIGPGAGEHGGLVVAEGTLEQISAVAESPTGAYFAQPQPPIRSPRSIDHGRCVHLHGATLNNLDAVDVRLPLGLLTCVTGVSGSGKSSLISDTLVPAIRRVLGAPAARPGPFAELQGCELIERIIPVDQSPIGRTSRSNPATYCGVFDDIRKVFAATREAKQRGFNAARFSFNVAAGRCAECMGHGVQRIEMNFLPDQFIRCGTCGGARFNHQTLAIRYRGQSIADVLDMTLDEAADFFENFASIHQMVSAVRSVGLGYLRLGQASNTLSGGEAQRLKLASFLGKAKTSNTLFVLDEPTTGLHFQDVEQLIGVLDQLVVGGNTVLVVEHHMDVIRAADWVIDMGPDGGVHGGKIVAIGTPESIAKNPASVTGRWLGKG